MTSSSSSFTRVKDAETKDPPSHRVAFSTRSKIDVMDDGYKWRKYGKKSVKNNINKRLHGEEYVYRNYYKLDKARALQRVLFDVLIKT
ncbi:hypothetical protein YC2023_113838 [Brassica napus]